MDRDGHLSLGNTASHEIKRHSICFMMKSHCILSIILLGSLSSFLGKSLMPGPATQKPPHDRFVPAPAQLLPHGAASWFWSPAPSCGFWAKLPSTTPVQCFPVCNSTITKWNGRCLAWCKDLDYSCCICGQKIVNHTTFDLVFEWYWSGTRATTRIDNDKDGQTYKMMGSRRSGAKAAQWQLADFDLSSQASAKIPSMRSTNCSQHHETICSPGTTCAAQSFNCNCFYSFVTRGAWSHLSENWRPKKVCVSWKKKANFSIFTGHSLSYS